MTNPSTGTGTDATKAAEARGAAKERQRSAIHRDRRVRSLAVLIVLLIIFTFVNLWWTSHIARSEQQKWCGLLITLDNADKHAPPPKTTFGRELVKDFSDLRHGFGCG